MPVEHQPPEAVAMIVADAVLRDVATGKVTIQGAYRTLAAPEFPLILPSIVVYVMLTEGYGRTALKLQLVDADDSRPPIFEVETFVDFPNPLATVEVVFAKAHVVIPEPGEYRLQLFGAGAPIRERRLQIALAEDSDVEDSDGP